MELCLKIDLTDEQYNDIMTKSYKELFESDDFKDALGKIIAQSMHDFLKSPTGQDLIKNTLSKSSGYYGSYSIDTAIGAKLVEKATEGYANQLAEPMIETYRNILLKGNTLEMVFKELLVSRMSEALVRGADRAFDEMTAKQINLDMEVGTLKSAISNLGHCF